MELIKPNSEVIRRNKVQAKCESKYTPESSSDLRAEDFDPAAGVYVAEDLEDHGTDVDEYDRWAWENGKLDVFPGCKRVGQGFANLIDRADIRATFWEDMTGPSHDTEELGFTIFNRY